MSYRWRVPPAGTNRVRLPANQVWRIIGESVPEFAVEVMTPYGWCLIQPDTQLLVGTWVHIGTGEVFEICR